MSAEITTEPARGPGRPRDTAIEDRVLRAALELLREKPLGEEFTLAELVERSGTSRAAIYRRWESRQAILVAALDHDRRPVGVQPRDTLLDTLLATFLSALDVVGESDQPLINLRVVLGLKDPDLQQTYWERHVRRRRRGLLEILRRAQQEGEVRSDADLEATLDLLNGAVYYQTIVRGDPLSLEARDRVAAAIRIVWHGIAAEAATVASE